MAKAGKGKANDGAVKQRRNVVVAGMAISTLVAAKLLFNFFWNRDRDVRKHIKVRLCLTPSEILALADDIIEKSKDVHDAVAAVPLDKVSYETVIEPLACLEAEEFAVVQSCVFPSLVATTKDIRDASTEAEKKVEAHHLQCSMREDVYRVVKAYSRNKEKLQLEAQHFVDNLVKGYERLGLNLCLEARVQVQRLRKSIAELCIIFQKNLNDDVTTLLFKEEELLGMPTEFIKGLEKARDGRLKVTLKSTVYFPIMEHCKVGPTRRALAIAYEKRCMHENIPILEKVVKLRHAAARLLGYANHADYVTETRMAKSSLKVRDFLNSISGQISGLAAKELEKLRAKKKEEEGTEEFWMSDLSYYMRKVEDAEFKLDQEQIKEYFPIEVVTKGLLAVYEDLLGLIFREISNTKAWHPEVRLFSVKERATGEAIGYFYLDLYARNGKYTQTCVCPLQPRCEVAGGTHQMPVAALLASFMPSVEDKVLLRYSEVEKFFHEFGHVMHHICTNASFARFSGLRAEDDFVEAPSHMLENWCVHATSLKLMSGHYKDVKRSIPDEVCKALARKRRSHAGILTKRQTLLGLLDQTIHSSDQVSTLAILQQLYPQIMEGISMLEGTNLFGSFSHLMGGYDAAYYSYLWNEAIAADIFESKFKENMLSAAAGKKFRDKILSYGASKDAFTLVSDFLGRNPSEGAFLRSKQPI